MQKFFTRYLDALSLRRWQVISPEELKAAEHKRVLDRLYGKK